MDFSYLGGSSAIETQFTVREEVNLAAYGTFKSKQETEFSDAA